MRWTVSLVGLAVLLGLALWGMRHGWAGRAARSRALLPALPVVPGDPGAARTGPLPGMYVSTVRADDPLDRVVAPGLGIRASATVQVFDAGVHLDVAGTALFVPTAALRTVATSSGQAGKVVGKDGLVVLEWLPPAPAQQTLATAVRMRRAADRDTLLTAARALTAPKETS